MEFAFYVLIVTGLAPLFTGSFKRPYLQGIMLFQSCCWAAGAEQDSFTLLKMLFITTSQNRSPYYYYRSFIISFARLFGFLFKKIRQPSRYRWDRSRYCFRTFHHRSPISRTSIIFFSRYLHWLPCSSSARSGWFFSCSSSGWNLTSKPSANRRMALLSSATPVSLFPMHSEWGLAYFHTMPTPPMASVFLSFALFMGITMSITAFRCSARILQEKDSPEPGWGYGAYLCSRRWPQPGAYWLLLSPLVKSGSSISVLSP